MNQYEPFFRFLIGWLDKPLSQIGMSKTVFFSGLLVLSLIFPNLIRPEWAEWIQNFLMPMVTEVKLGAGQVKEVPTVSVFQLLSLGGLLLSIDDRLKTLKTVNISGGDKSSLKW